MDKVSVGCGTFRLYELDASVVTATAPVPTKEVVGGMDKVTVFPPLILILFPVAVKVGCGTSML